MVDRIGGKSSLAHEAIQSALRSQQNALQGVEDAAQRVGGGVSGAQESTNGPSFASKIHDGLSAVDAEIKSADGLASDVATGRIQDFHEVAVQIKRADLSFKFALEIRNKLVDAYREVMRMNV